MPFYAAMPLSTTATRIPFPLLSPQAYGLLGVLQMDMGDNARAGESFRLDPVAVEKAITKRTKAIVPVHMRGAPAQMDAIMDVAKRKVLLREPLAP